MRKFLSLLLVSICLISSTTSCKEKNDPVKEDPAAALKNTTWTQSESMDVIGYTIDFVVTAKLKSDMTFDFIADMTSTLPDFGDESNHYVTSGTWVYDEPTLYLTTEGATISAEIKDNVMCIDSPEMEAKFGFELELKKQ